MNLCNFFFAISRRDKTSHFSAFESVGIGWNNVAKRQKKKRVAPRFDEFFFYLSFTMVRITKIFPKSMRIFCLLKTCSYSLATFVNVWLSYDYMHDNIFGHFRLIFIFNFLSTHFHGVGIGPHSKILAVNIRKVYNSGYTLHLWLTFRSTICFWQDYEYLLFICKS